MKRWWIAPAAVAAGAALWLPVSFVIATVLHGVLIAKATVWPAWTQLLHPVATLIAKSKLLVLPAYPAAWPQAKQHSLVQASFRVYEYLAARPEFDPKRIGPIRIVEPISSTFCNCARF